ncbi:Domain of uncharacterised function (DUF397) [Mycobacterium tuberculosis]|nr:Domain of uncharacterised function (DUF397) [Mycobacterium tuberculosis]
MSDLVWRKASWSTENGGDCVELAPVSSLIAIRDSKDPDGPMLIVDHKEFRRLTETLKNL